MLRSSFVVLVAALFLTYVAASSEDNALEEDVDRTTSALTNIKFPGELSLPSNLVSGVVTAGAVVLGIVGVAALLALVLPVFGVKLCYLTGTCDPLGGGVFGGGSQQHLAPPPALGSSGHAYDAYGTPYSSQQAQQQQAATYSSAGYQRRSLEYVGPILRALSNAYDKYAAPRILGQGQRSSAHSPLSSEANNPSAAADAAPGATKTHRRR